MKKLIGIKNPIEGGKQSESLIMSFKDEINFCINFLRIQENLAEESCIYSPISMLNALAMIYAGADGNSANQIADVIGKDINETEVINYYSDFIQRHKGDKDNIMSNEDYDKAVKELFASLDGVSEGDKRRDGSSKTSIPTVHADGAPFRIISTNKLFFDKQIHLLNSFCKIMREKFDGNFQQVNFKHEKDEAVKIINDFVKVATNEKIEKIFDRDEIEEDTTIVLVNAIYFIGKWAKPFGRRQKEMFYSKIPRKIDLMSTTLECVNYTEGGGWKCVGIPYKDNKVWMFIVLPNQRDGLQDLVEKMDYGMFMECTKSNVIGNLLVTMPVFEISTDFNLIKDLRKLGINDIFNQCSCNLTKMIDKKYHGQDHFIYKAIHKAVIKVDEYGTEAAAVSAFGGRILCMRPLPQPFIINHPFLYFIVSTDNQKEKEPTEILFAGIFC